MVEFLARIYGTKLPYHPGKWRVMKALGPWLKHSGTYTVTREGVIWKLSLECWIQRAIYYLSQYEGSETDILEQTLKPGDTFLDIGANIGYFSMIAARIGADVHAWEPVEHVRQRLIENSELNGFDISVSGAAVSDAAGVVEFHLPAESNWGMGSIGGSSTQVVQVPTVRIDDLGFEAVKLIKIDVEGAEMNALRGAEQTIRRCQPTMLVEMNPEALSSMGGSPAGLKAQLEDLGYDLMTPRGGPFVMPKMGGYCNILCRPKR